MTFKSELMLYAGLGALALLAVAYISKNPKEVGTAVAGVAVDLADGVLTGTITSVGAVIGVPETNLTECQKAKAEGRTWDASFACPAGDFLNYVWN